MHQVDNEIKTSKSINSANIYFNNIDDKIKFSNSTNDFNKLNFPNSKIYELNKEKASKNNQENTMKNEDFIKEMSQRKSVSGINEFYSNCKNSRDIYSTRTFNEKSNNEGDNKLYNPSEDIDQNYRTNTNPNVFETKNKIENKRDFNLRREYNDVFEIEKRSRPLSVNNYSSKYFKRDGRELMNIRSQNGFISEQQQDVRSNYNYDSNQVDYNVSSRRPDLEQKYSSSNSNLPDNRNLDNFDLKKLSNQNNVLSSNNRNYTPSINNSENKSLSAHNIPETIFKYDSGSYKKSNKMNLDSTKNIINNPINPDPEYNKNSYNLTATEENARADPSLELNTNNRLDEIIDISKYNYKDSKNGNKNENNNIKDQSNNLKVRYLSEKRIFRDKKDDQKNLISNF